MSEENKQPEIGEVLATVMQMVQYYLNHINYEMLRILCDTGYCNQYVNMCVICKQKEQAQMEMAQKGDEEE